MKKMSRLWSSLGPGFVTGAADDDPSGIATYSQAGSQFGFQFLWLSLFSFPLMSIVQEMCARLGLATGRGLAANIKRHFPPYVLFGITGMLLFANVLNIGADLGAMAQSVQLLFPSLPFSFLVIVLGIACLVLQIFLSYQTYAKYLKWLALILLAYIFASVSVPGVNWGEVLKETVFPTIILSKDTLLIICAVLGTTISPYLFFWQTSQEVEEEIAKGYTSIVARTKAYNVEGAQKMRFDVWIGMLFSNVIMFFIISSCALTLFKGGGVTIATAADAANALRPFVGDSAYVVFALGIIGTGLLAVPVLAGSATYAVSETLGIKEGLNKKWYKATAFYGVLTLSIIAGIAVNFVGIDTIKALFYSAVVNGFVAPFVLAIIVLLSQNKKVMKGAVNNVVTTSIGWIVVLLMSLVAVVTVFSLLS